MVSSPNHTFSWAHAVVSLGGEYSDILALYVGADHFWGVQCLLGFSRKENESFFWGGGGMKKLLIYFGGNYKLGFLGGHFYTF